VKCQTRKDTRLTICYVAKALNSRINTPINDDPRSAEEYRKIKTKIYIQCLKLIKSVCFTYFKWCILNN